MAYNLEPLVKILEQIIHPEHGHRWSLDPSIKPEIESLMEKTLALKKLFGNLSPLTGDKTASLASRISDAAYEAEDILESHLVDPIGEGFSLRKVALEFDSVAEEIKNMMDWSHVEDRLPASSRADLNPKKILVGLSDDVIQLKERLIREEAKLEIIPIVGMGGIGKTALARNIYDDSLIVSHFDTCAWATISQAYNVRSIMLDLLGCITGKNTNKMRQMQDDELAVRLHKSLWGRRYLIVLDDIWDNKAWDDINIFIPNDNNGSRIMVTTRESSVADYAGSNSSPHHQMHLLNEDDNWKLLREKVFAQETCPPELETIGKTIADNCRGLPLAILVIAGFLSQTERTSESWAQVAEDVTAVVAKNDEQFSKILSLSYNHLPNHLKPCFLYMSAFPHENEIQASKLIKLWAAEGFVEPVSDKSLEETAEMYLKSLVDRNLIFSRRLEIKGTVKSYDMHDLLRDLCVRKASEENFLHVKNKLLARKLPTPTDTLSLRRVSVQIYAEMEPMPLARSLIWVDMLTVKLRERSLAPVLFKSRLLRVLDLLGIQFDEFPEEMLQLINLRYLALASRSSLLPCSISELWNLQTMIFEHLFYHGNTKEIAIEAILGIAQLRHVEFKGTYPLLGAPDGKSFGIQANLQTLSGIIVGEGFDRVIQSLPNLKKLKFWVIYGVSHNLDLTCLTKLETLKCSSNLSETSLALLSVLIFPPSLKKLTLWNCRIPVGYMNRIGSLPSLEVLRLKDCMLLGETWEPTEGEFCNLRYLVLHNVSLVRWEADETNFPRLERLVIVYCAGLEEIPSGIGEIPTLEIIQLYYADDSVVASARKIQEEQLDLGNYDLRVYIRESNWSEFFSNLWKTD